MDVVAGERPPQAELGVRVVLSEGANIHEGHAVVLVVVVVGRAFDY